MSVAFVAGATGFTGRAIARQDAARFGVDLCLQVRPKAERTRPLPPEIAEDPRLVEVSLAAPEALAAALEGVDAILQLIGTVRARFREVGNYQEVDFTTTAQLLAAAKAARVPHFILMSSVGAGFGLGPYLAWKKRTEIAVRESGVPFTIVRPSYLAGDPEFPERSTAANTAAFLGGLADTPFGGLFGNLRPINIQVLARLFLLLAKGQPTGGVLGGAALFQMARREAMR